MTSPPSFLTKLDRLPPFIVHALARHNQTRPPLDDLAKRSGLSLRTFTRIARKYTWAKVKASQIDGFCRACGVDILHPRSEIAYIKASGRRKTRKFAHLSTQQLRVFERQCLEWCKRLHQP